ncbi:MAG: GNAT family N-acetyltransferase [Sphingopyxis sp.]|nr:GNAT family N-acetyltransferase [Sphingopyxis sp.]
MISAPQPLAGHHVVDAFECGEPSLDDWLKRRAAGNQSSGASRTYVVCEGDAVVGYYCLAAGALGHADAPGALRRNRPDPIPVMVLGRLAIRRDHHQAGLGTALLRDALVRTLQAAEIAGVAALLVHALSEEAKRFYRSRGFVESPVKPMTMCMILESARKALDAGR